MMERRMVKMEDLSAPFTLRPGKEMVYWVGGVVRRETTVGPGACVL